ncbi:MAG: hypothetical protein R2845_03030 [Thermomicrobiales bacterium]
MTRANGRDLLTSVATASSPRSSLQVLFELRDLIPIEPVNIGDITQRLKIDESIGQLRTQPLDIHRGPGNERVGCFFNWAGQALFVQ